MTTNGFNKSNTVGRDVDEVIIDMQNSGLVCGKKFTSKTVFDNQLYGGVKCYVKEYFPICLDSYHVFLSFNLKTNKVDGILKDRRTNCF